MGRYAWIIFVVVIVWQIVGGIVQNAAKKQQQAKMSEAARRRRDASPGSGSGRPSQTSTAPAASGPRNARLEDLAARRKAQLEELRRRRMTGASGGGRPKGPAQEKIGRAASSPQVRIPGTGRPSARGPVVTPAPAPALRKEIEQMSADLRSIHGDQDRDRVARQEQTRLKQQQQAEAQRRKEQDADARRRQTKVRREATDVQDTADAYAADYRRVKRERIARYKRLMNNRRTLRDLFLLRELLDPPVSMRSGPGQI